MLRVPGFLAATFWHRPISDSSDELAVEADREIRAGILVALMGGIVSLTFGVLGGVIGRSGLQ